MNKTLTPLAVVILTVLVSLSAFGKSKDLVRFKPQQVTAFDREEKIALLVGVSNYPRDMGLSPLDYADSDVKKIGAQLEELGFKVKILTNHKALSGSILNLLGDLAQMMDQNEGTFIFYFSGHGFSHEGINYLAGYETNPNKITSTAVKLSEIQSMLVASGAKQRMLFIDACRNDPGKPGSKSVVGGRSFVNFKEAEGTRILFSTKFGGLSYEYSDLGHGVFSYYVLRGLKGQAKGQDGHLSFRDLSDYVSTKVKNFGFKRNHFQKPYVGGEAYGDFLIDSSTQAMLDRSFLTVQTEPNNANIRIMNISERYQAGMVLEPGDYHFVISAEGYQELDQWRRLAPGDQRLVFQLQAEPQWRAGQVFRDELNNGSLGPEMVVIPAGLFRMGDIQGGGDDDEKPVHRVNIKAFAMGQTEVTFAEYDRFAEATGRKKPGDRGWGRGDRPVINVSWDDAVAYAEWLSQQTDQQYRLPSESEWEYAARAGSKTKYSWGNDIGSNKVNCYKDYCSDAFEYTAPVASFKPNAFGLYDVHGNVWEWVLDCWNKSYEGAPEGGRAWESGGCGRRVLRGGSWGNLPWLVRSAFRGRFTRDNRNLFIGFRLARTF